MAQPKLTVMSPVDFRVNSQSSAKAMLRDPQHPAEDPRKIEKLCFPCSSSPPSPTRLCVDSR
jgi:hypothetical protein